jgi:hypothetical protein
MTQLAMIKKKSFNNKMQMPLKKNEYLHDDKI